MKLIKLLLKPLIWIKDFQDNAVSYLTKKVDKKVGEIDKIHTELIKNYQVGKINKTQYKEIEEYDIVFYKDPNCFIT